MVWSASKATPITRVNQPRLDEGGPGIASVGLGEACICHPAPTTASRWIHRLGERVGNPHLDSVSPRRAKSELSGEENHCIQFGLAS